MSDSAAALERYAHRLRRQRIVYFGVITAVVVALGVTVGVAWSHGETAHTTLHRAADPPSALPATTPRDSLHAVWRTSDQAALGTAQWQGTVVVHGAHTVRGADARTGHTTWSYTRSNRTVCAALQAGGTTVAIYRVGGDCDEVTGLDSNTGARKWTRTLDEDARPLNGRGVYQVANQGTYYTVTVRSSSVIYALDPGSGSDRWVYSRFGCTITGAVLGSAGALIAQNCTRPQCQPKQKFCGKGLQLLLRNGYNGRNDDDMVNPDQITWDRFGVTGQPVAADSVVASYSATRQTVTQYTATRGQTRSTTRLSPAPASGVAVDATVPATNVVLLHAGGYTYAISAVGTPQSWSTATTGPPTVVNTRGNPDLPELSTSRVTVPSRAGAVALDGSTGRPVRAFGVPTPSGSRVTPLGAGFLVAASSGTVAYG